MSEAGVEHRTTTILAAGVVGYSRLMGEDDEGSLQTLNEFRAVIDGLITEHHGHVFDSAGDSVIAEFASPVAPPRPLKA